MNFRSASLLLFPLLMLSHDLTIAQAQTDNPDHAKHVQQDPAAHTKTSGPLAPLQKALERKSPTPVAAKTSMKVAESMPAAPAGGGMGGGDMMGMMSQMMGQMMPKMAGPPMETPAGSPTNSELPGFAGASHIYHIGATGFFVDHASMVNFKTAQLMALNRLKEKSVLTQSEAAREILRAEEELWQLTALEQPVIKNIEAKVNEIEQLKGKKRISFIRHVGEAAKILTAKQRAILLGTATPVAEEKPTPDSMDGM